MTTIENLKSDFAQKYPANAYAYETHFGANVMTVPKDDILNVLSHLKNSGFDFLMQVAGADYPQRQKRFDVVYELFSSKTFSIAKRTAFKFKVSKTVSGISKSTPPSTRPDICS